MSQPNPSGPSLKPVVKPLAEINAGDAIELFEVANGKTSSTRKTWAVVRRKARTAGKPWQVVVCGTCIDLVPGVPGHGYCFGGNAANTIPA